PDYWLGRLVITRALGVIYLIAFLVAINQFRPLLGERGLLPAPRFLERVSFQHAPSLFHLRYSDRLLAIASWTGVLLSASIVVGLIKIRSDPCWRDLSCLDYHHETQPMPNPLSWFFHHLPRPLHRVEVLGNHFAQLVAPLGLAFPQPISDAAGVVIVVTQGWL